MNRQSDRLPQGWKWAKLGDVCKVNPRRPTGFDWDPHTKTTFVPMPSVDGQTGAITQPQERIFAEVSRGYTYFEEGDVLFAKITPCMQNGKHAIASGLGNGFGFGSTEFHVLRPSGAVLAEWVHKFLRQPSVLAEAVHHFRGSVGQQRVPKEYLHSLQIPLPPLTEQKRIAALLNQQMAYVEKARQAAEEMLEAAQALPGAFLRQVFPAHGDALPAGWQWTKLGDVCKIVSGSTPKTNVTAYWNGTVTWITPTDMGKLTTKYISSSQRAITQTGYASCSTKLIPAGAVIMSTRAPIGHLGIASVPLCTSQGCKTFVPGADVDTEFLYFSLLTHIEDIQALGSGSTFQEVSKTKLSKFEICLPPLTEQKRIAALLKEQMAYVETVRMSAREQLDAINALPAALLRRAFAGTL